MYNIFIYEINEKEFIGKDNEVYVSYGIDCFQIENGFKELIIQIIDISLDFSKMQNFINTLNNLKLSYIHLYDAVDDFLCSEN